MTAQTKTNTFSKMDTTFITWEFDYYAYSAIVEHLVALKEKIGGQR